MNKQDYTLVAATLGNALGLEVIDHPAYTGLCSLFAESFEEAYENFDVDKWLAATQLE